MLQKLSQHLTEVAKNVATVEKLLSPYLFQGNFRCSIEKQIVHFEYEHGLDFEKSSEQAQLLLKTLNVSIFSIKGGVGNRNLLLRIKGNEGVTKLYLDLTNDGDEDLLTQYLCEQFLLLFKKLSRKSK